MYPPETTSHAEMLTGSRRTRSADKIIELLARARPGEGVRTDERRRPRAGRATGGQVTDATYELLGQGPRARRRMGRAGRGGAVRRRRRRRRSSAPPTPSSRSTTRRWPSTPGGLRAAPCGRCWPSAAPRLLLLPNDTDGPGPRHAPCR